MVPVSGGRAVIVGVSTHWGSELARTLARSGRFDSLIGLDTSEPEVPLPDVEFVEADICDPSISRVLPRLDPDVVVHCGIVWYPEGKRARGPSMTSTSSASLQLLAACEKAGTCGRWSSGSAAIYGNGLAAPFTEEMARRYPLVTRFQRDIGEPRGLLRQLRLPPPRGGLLHAALSARDRPRPRQPRC